MRQAQSKPALQELKANNAKWFSPGNKRFFGDINYMVFYSQVTGERYLVRRTAAWSDMFTGTKRPHYRINPISDNWEIQPLIDTEFSDLAEVRRWLRLN